MTPRVREILTWYSNENLSFITQLTRILNHGHIAGSGKFLMTSSSQSLSCPPRQCFHKNTNGFDPGYHLRLSINIKANVTELPQGALESAARDYVGDVPYFMTMQSDLEPITQLQSAIHLGACGVVYNYEDQDLIRLSLKRAKNRGLVCLVKLGSSTSIDEICYRAHKACQMGASIILTQLPANEVKDPALKKYYNYQQTRKLENRVRHILESCLNGRRLLMVDFESELDNFELLREALAGGALGVMLKDQMYHWSEKELMESVPEFMDTMIGKV